jgi:hypothetical protein
MKHLLSLLCLAALLTAGTGFAQAQQVPSNTKCNEESGLSWTMNSETDITKYRVYSSNAPLDVTIDNSTLILMEVPHDPAAAQNGSVTQTLNSVLFEGPKYFRVSAVDSVNNESPLSLEVGCDYNLIPSAPSNVQIIIKLKAPETPQ